MVTWFRKHGTALIVGGAFAVLPLLYIQFTDVSWYPLDPIEHLIQNGLAYVFLVLFCYVNFIVFIPRWYLTKRYGRFAVIVISCLLGVVWVSHRIEQWVFFKPPKEPTVFGWVRQILWAENMFERPQYDPSRIDKIKAFKPEDSFRMTIPRQPSSDGLRNALPAHRGRGGPGPWMKMAFIFLVGGISTLLSVSIQVAAYLRQVEKEQLATELSHLKAQIYPHFLFNTLNSIYALAIRKDDRTPDTIVKLAEFMRYMIRDAHRNKVPLRTETAYITNYIDLQKTRLREAVTVNFQVEGDMDRWQVAPLLLFSFIENAFKYGVNPKEESVISITLIEQNGELRFMATNRKVATPALNESMGVGLQNARERLALLYPGAHMLTINNTPTYFTVNLTLTLSS